MSTQPVQTPSQAPMRHTPGPWHIDREQFNHDDCNAYASIRCPHELDAYHIATIEYGCCPTSPGMTPGDQAPANAMLIAAAPDLLEALRFARSVIQSGEEWTPTCESVIGGAIRKALGQQEGAGK